VQLAHLHGGIDGAKVYEYNQNPETCQVLPEEKRGSHLRLDSPEGDEPCIEIVRRVSIGGRPDAWTAERRERYLLRLDVPQPLSVDVRVWAAAAQSEGDTIVVSVLLRGVAKDGQGIWLPRALHVDDEVELLGYDVADDVMTSGLSNCGYSDEEKERLRPVWAPQLNRFHLFDRANLALQFKGITEARVPEHAPFFVFGLYRLLS